jgi:branched-chain amino acid transport system ATP-binding protein
MAAPTENDVKATLSLAGVDAGYENTTVIRDVSLEIKPGSVVALLGANGAGKTTTIRAIAGTASVSRGTISFDGTNITSLKPSARAKMGLCTVPEGRSIYRTLTVQENLLMFTPLNGRATGNVDLAVEAFPALRPRLNQVAGSLSGGEQQMLALSRAYLANPKVIVLDELSTGLAPLIVGEIYDRLRRLAGSGVSLLIVEQYVDLVLELADWVYVMARGVIASSGPPNDIGLKNILASYLGENHTAAASEHLEPEQT